MKKVKSRLQSVLLSCIGVVIVILLWDAAVRYTLIGKLLPSPMEVLERFFYVTTHPIGKQYTLGAHLLVSLKRVLSGFICAECASLQALLAFLE